MVNSMGAKLMFPEGLPCVKHCFKCRTWIILLNLHSNSMVFNYLHFSGEETEA